MKIKIGIFMMVVMLGFAFFTGCASQPVYQTIAPADAQKLLQSDSGAILLDVRTSTEYEEGHIPGSTLLSIDEFQTRGETLPPDKNTTIIVYCHSGNRSQAAAKQLLDMGYKHVYDLGGIINWPYEIQK